MAFLQAPLNLVATQSHVLANPLDTGWFCVHNIQNFIMLWNRVQGQNAGAIPLLPSTPSQGSLEMYLSWAKQNVGT